MKRITIFGFFGVLLLVGLMTGFARYSSLEREEFQEIRLSYAVDYAVDASVSALLDTGELELDYGETSKSKLDPNKALNTFVDIFLMNYDMNTNDENRAHVKNNFIPIFAVCTFDGYYFAQPRLVKSSTDVPENLPSDEDWQLVFGPKMPYKYIYGTDSYALNFGGDYSYKMSGNILSKYIGLPPGLESKDDIIREINKVISSDMMYAVDDFNKENVNWHNTFFIPAGLTTYTSVNPIEGPSVIVLVQDVDLATPKPISTFSVGGGKLGTRRVVVGYQRGGINYYCYADQAYAIVPSVVVLEIFSTCKEAAEAGYACDIKNMQN